ncbi:MAG: hypothetical protein D6744_09155 [Planctomycetota bacterium]|nr:MAG: hypothetical protein D6744_09155 [Planctomycetota bacterium]
MRDLPGVVVFFSVSAVAAALAGCRAPAQLSIDDLIVGPQLSQATTVAYVQRPDRWRVASGVRDEPVEFFLDDRLAGTVRTNRDGRSEFRLPRVPAADGVVEAAAVVDGRTLRVAAPLFRWNPDRVSIVVDVDHGLIEPPAKAPFWRRTPPRRIPRAGAVDALRWLSEQFQVAYLTSRPRLVSEQTRAWLAEYGFPDGPLICAAPWRGDVGASALQSRRLLRLRRSWPNVLIGIGDGSDNAEAFAAAGMLAMAIREEADAAEDEGGAPAAARVFTSWSDAERFFRRNVRRLRSPAAVRRMILEQSD